jgi:hypothetical protein
MNKERQKYIKNYTQPNSKVAKNGNEQDTKEDKDPPYFIVFPAKVLEF